LQFVSQLAALNGQDAHMTLHTELAKGILGRPREFQESGGTTQQQHHHHHHHNHHLANFHWVK
jgi:hypothetical protein